MKTRAIVPFISLWLLLCPASVQAAEQLFLPAVFQRSESTAIYQIDSTRLWHRDDNNPALRTDDFCGQQHKAQVHIFDQRGDSGPHTRLNGVIVQVIQMKNGQRIEELRATGVTGFAAGVVEFELFDQAEVRILTDVDGRQTTSQIAFISTNPQHIPINGLITSGYCQDEASCQAFVQANQCAGWFSWNVVFKRNY